MATIENPTCVSFDEALARPSRAKHLDLWGDELALPDLDVPAAVGSLKRLETVRIQGYGTIRIPVEFGALTSLRELILESIQGEIPEPILTLPSLQRLDLTFTGRGVIPASIGRLRRLRVLRLSGIKSLPPEIGELSELQELRIYGSELDQLPDGFDRLSGLRTLSMWGCGFRGVPRSVCRLTGLESLDISNTFIDELPIEIRNLKSLRALHFNKPFAHHHAEKYETRVKQIRASWAELTRLRELTLCHQSIMDVSNNIRNWTQLETLDLSYNQMDEFPDELLGLTSLRELRLPFNRISSLPVGIGALSKLETLILMGNPISELPESLFGLEKLKVLDLEKTEISEVDRRRIQERMPKTILAIPRTVGSVDSTDGLS